MIGLKSQLLNETTLPKVMVIERDPVSRCLIENLFGEHGFAGVYFDSFEEARSHLQQAGNEKYDTVLCEYSIDGEECISFIKELKELGSNLAIIVFSALESQAQIHKAMSHGAFEFVRKTVEYSKLLEVLQAAVKKTHWQRHLHTTAKAVEGIGQTQMALLNRSSDETPFKTDLIIYPKLDAGGDFVSRFDLGSEKYITMLTDVSGHDLRAAYISAYFQGMVRGLVEGGKHIIDIFNRFNSFLADEWNHESEESSMNTSVAVSGVMLDYSEQRLKILCCGAPIPLYYEPGKVGVTAGEQWGYPLGWFPDAGISPIEMGFTEGACLYLWTDGVDSLADELEVNFMSVISRLAQLDKDGEKPDWFQYADDDIMVTRLQFCKKTESDELPVFFEKYAGSDFDKIDQLQNYWQQSLEFALPSTDVGLLAGIILPLREGMLNAMVHGSSKSPTKYSTLQADLIENQRVLRVIISDTGPGHDFDFNRHEEEADLELFEAHRGLIMMKYMADELTLERSGAQITLKFNLQA